MRAVCCVTVFVYIYLFIIIIMTSRGGPYCLDNTEGGLVYGNSISSNCGMLFDIDTCSNFNVSGNTFSQPGNTWNGVCPSLLPRNTYCSFN